MKKYPNAKEILAVCDGDRIKANEIMLNNMIEILKNMEVKEGCVLPEGFDDKLSTIEYGLLDLLNGGKNDN